MTSPSHNLLCADDGQAHLEELSAKLGFHSPWKLAEPELGLPVASSRSSWVRRIRIDSRDYFAKTYVYNGIRDRVRGTLRNTGPFCASRAQQEFHALAWFRAADFPTPETAGFLEERTFGWVRRALLVTAAFPGRDLASLLPRESEASRMAIAEHLGRFVARMHALGFRDGNLDLRNLLLADDRSTMLLAKIDSPKHRIVATGLREDRWTRADWARLSPQLAPFGMTEVARGAAANFSEGLRA
jgi:hypothetical protein